MSSAPAKKEKITRRARSYEKPDGPGLDRAPGLDQWSDSWQGVHGVGRWMTCSQARESCKVRFQKKEPLVDMRLSVCLFVSPTDKLYASVRCGVPSEDESNGKRAMKWTGTDVAR